MFPQWAPISSAITEYQDPAKADKITAITQELEETKDVLVRSLLATTNRQALTLLSNCTVE